MTGPMISWPRIVGVGVERSPWKVCTSLPHTVQQLTRTSTSPVRKSGVGNALIVIAWPLPLNTAAMHVSPWDSIVIGLP